MSGGQAVQIPRLAHGERTVFSPSGEELNQLLAAVTVLTSEVAVLRQRVRSLESLSVQAGTLAEGAVDRHEPNQAERQEQAQWHERLLNRVFYRYIGKTR
ncbi:MAG: hypothetical protein H7A18_02460 [Sinobacteraceae bacterium]|nr:hypothetical protein [Nevskiaceae bacterium]MCP5359500.1 hypothetical protein [Nevskiaceae bacterium]MCP5466843.1 hypothetical protein [Nevskiaceae bacterium]MCP5470932.1 hypothetical protein [Nevskiaceae bacterium]